MDTHKVAYKVFRTGSKLFDIVIINAAKKVCEDIPGLNYEVTEKEICISGELDDEGYAKYQEFMLNNET